MSKSQQLHTNAMKIAQEAHFARENGDLDNYLKLTKLAFEQEKEAAWALFYPFDAEPTRSVLFRSAAWLAYHCGEWREAERMVAAGLLGDPPLEIIRELRALYKRIVIYLED